MTALIEAEAGRALFAGLFIEFAAIVFDRIIHSWGTHRKAAIGLA
jgi:ABC-type proline/glycine betaine transport system permease subunit